MGIDFLLSLFFFNININFPLNNDLDMFGLVNLSWSPEDPKARWIFFLQEESKRKKKKFMAKLDIQKK